MSRIHPDVEEAFEQIDAAVFSGDAFYEAENLDKLERYVGRWQRAIVARREIAEARRADFPEGIETERQLAELIRERDEAREENARLREALLTIATPTDDNHLARSIALDAFEMSIIAKKALTP